MSPGHNPPWSKTHISKSELKLDIDYENKFTEVFRKNRLFEGRNPDKLTTFITHDVASAAIEESLLDAFELGDALLWEFMTTRLVGTGIEKKPSVAFSSPLPKVKAKSFLNLYDVEKKGEITEKVVRSYDRSILKRSQLS